MVYEIIPKKLGSMSSPIYKTTNRGELNTSQTSQLILLMVQKSGDFITTVWMFPKPVVNIGINFGLSPLPVRVTTRIITFLG